MHAIVVGSLELGPGSGIDVSEELNVTGRADFKALGLFLSFISLSFFNVF